MDEKPQMPTEQPALEKQIDGADQAEALLQQYRSDQPVPHKRHKLVLALFAAILLIIIGVLVGLLLAEDDEAATEANTNVSTESAPEEPVAEEKLSSDYLENYTIEDEETGTMVTVSIDGATGTRTIERNALPNHDTGEFPNEGNPNEISAQDFSQTFPLVPTFTGNAQTARTVGIAINGVKFEPDTAERAACDGNVVHNVEAIQNVTDLGLDFNNAHVQPNGEYHYHGVSDLLVNLYASDNDLVHVGFAADGHLMYYSKSGAYKPSYRIGQDEREGENCSYTVPGPSGGKTILFGKTKDGSLKSDWDYNTAYGDLDECNGVEINGQYVYFITDAYPYIGRCLNGEFSEESLGTGGAQVPFGTQGAPTNQAGGPPSGQGPPQ